MTDVDAIRWMASEHDLEFVDLDTYGVDPAAGEILPASLLRLHHVVAIKRKFGTPVIATADPEDHSAHDMVRTSIGRDFISVVASRDQIGAYLDRLFGPEGDYGQPSDVDFGNSEDGSPPTAQVEDDRTTSGLVTFDDVVVFDDSVTFGSGVAEVDPADGVPADPAKGEEPVDEEPEGQTNGKRRRRRDEA